MPNVDEPPIIDALRVLPRFGVGPNAKLTRLNSGEHCVFRVDDGEQRYVLRLRQGRLTEGARALQFAWLRAVRAQTGVGVPEPILTVDGAESVPAGDDLNGHAGKWVLLRWVWGERLAKPTDFVTPRVLGAVGETVAKLHQHSATYQPENIANAPTSAVADLVGDACCLADGTAERLFTAGDHALFIRAAATLASAMNELQDTPGQVGLIHGDLNPANWVFHSGEPRIIDFDEFSRGLFLFDLLGVLSTHPMWDEYPNFQRWLLEGYGRVRPMPPEVLRLADVMQAATLFAWLNHGCRLTDASDRAEFLKWVPATAKVVSRLAGTKH